MTSADVIRLLRTAGVELFLDTNTGRLKYRAPGSALTPFLRATLREYMPEIVYLFNERAAIMEYDGGMPRADAERMAAEVVLEQGGTKV